MKTAVYVVHCVDTEGPLNEDIYATFQRIKNLTGVALQPTPENLRKIQNKETDLHGYEDLAARVFSERLMNYNRDWHDVDNMLDHITSEKFRKSYADSEGNGWIYSWFIVDFADFDYNPRNRDIGYNNIYNHYINYASNHNMNQDDFQWHAHPMSIYKEAHHCSTSYMNSPHIVQSLAHRLIDCHSFPACFRPGVHTERPDSHWLLEQYIPFDYGNQAMELSKDDIKQNLGTGRFGDWRRALSSWEPYHPAHDDYQVPGNCNRWIFRCLNVGTRLRLMTQDETDKAFQRASDGIDTIIAFCDHDFRDMSYDVIDAYTLIAESAKKFPSVKWINAKAYDAARAVTKKTGERIKLTASLRSGAGTTLSIKSNIKTFGIQPFFVVKTKGERYINENLDVQKPNLEWSYTFDAEQIHWNDVELIGIAANSNEGSGSLLVLNSEGKILTEKDW